jgi:transcriptional regulator with XRE-family HTH domain
MLSVMTTPVGNRIETLRERRGLNLSQLAQYASVTRQWLRQVELGEIETPGGDKIERVATILGVSSTYLLTGRDAPRDDESENWIVRIRRFPPDVLRQLDRIGEAIFETNTEQQPPNKPRDGNAEQQPPDEPDTQAAGGRR